MFKKPSPPRPTTLSPPPPEPAPTVYKPIQLSVAPPRPAPGVAASILGAGLAFEGSICGDADLTIEGVMKGDVTVGRLVIGENAAFEGHICAHHVEVRGRVAGDIEAQAVKLTESAFVEGDITHGQLSIEAGAHFEGRAQALRRGEAAGPVEAEPATAEVVELEAARA